MDIEEYKKIIIETMAEIGVKYDEIILAESYHSNPWENKAWSNSRVLVVVTNEEPFSLTFINWHEKLEANGIPAIYDGFITLPYGGKGHKFLLAPPSELEEAVT